MLNTFRDSFMGQLIYNASSRRLLQYPEEKPGFVVPEQYTCRRSARSGRNTDKRMSEMTAVAPALDEPAHEKKDKRISATSRAVSANDVEDGLTESEACPPKVAYNPDIVDWYGPEDPENPLNWSLSKRCFVTFTICLLTFSIYIGSAIFAPGIPLIASQFGVSDVAATLGLTLFVVGYGVGPMFLSPLSELPQFGRTSVYIVSLFLFVVLQVPTALSKNLGALLPLRFLAGFVGSPPLATGGASVADIWAPEERAIMTGLWGLAGVCGPVLGPLLGGFAAQAKGWTWTMWILMWLSGGSLAFLAFFLPETSGQAILYRRAARLRKLTGNDALRCQAELEGLGMTPGEMAYATFVRPFVLGFREPIVFVWNMYVALLYGILYVFIASFEIVFVGNHGFNLGENGLAFMGLFFGAILGFAVWVPYAVFVVRPAVLANMAGFVPEQRLPLAMFGSILIPISMFWFGWTSAASVHWIVPIIGSSLFATGAFLLFLAGLNYLQDCYPRYVASVLAGNDFLRSMVGAALPLVSNAFFRNLGVGPACSILGGIGILMVPVPFILYRYGARIRALSKYAD